MREERTPDGCTFLVNTDVTDIKRHEEALTANEARLRAIFDNVPVAFFLKDAQGRYKFLNSRYRDWFGLDPELAPGKVVGDL